MTFDLISGLHMQIQTWHLPLRLCKHAKYYVKSGLTNVLKNANKTKNMHLFSIRIANYGVKCMNLNDWNCCLKIYAGHLLTAAAYCVNFAFCLSSADTFKTCLDLDQDNVNSVWI